MGVGRLLVNAIVGPLVIYAIFLGHTLCRMTLQTPDPIKVMDFPKGTTQQAKDQIISSRRTVIQEVMTLYRGDATDSFIKNFCTEDIEFEDPFQKYEGKEQVTKGLQLWSAMCDGTDITIHGEHHGPHEIVMDWTMIYKTSMLPKFTISFRTNILLEPSNDGKAEKIFRMYEDWNDRLQINEKNTIAIVGRLHQKLRRFMGTFIITIAGLFY